MNKKIIFLTFLFAILSSSLASAGFLDWMDRITGKATKETIKINACSDGTIYGSCSKNIPFYCDNGNLIETCSKCGCPSGYSCQAEGNCILVKENCFDRARNQDETDVDCGGICGATCEIKQSCKTSADCISSTCDNNICIEAVKEPEPVVTKEPEPTCFDGIQNRDEEAIDCGGKYCKICRKNPPTYNYEKCIDHCSKYKIDDLSFYKECNQICDKIKPVETIEKVMTEQVKPTPEEEPAETSPEAPHEESEPVQESTTETTPCPLCVCPEPERCEQGEYRCNDNTQRVLICIDGEWQPNDDYEGFCVTRTTHISPEGETVEEESEGILGTLVDFFSGIFGGGDEETASPSEEQEEAPPMPDLAVQSITFNGNTSVTVVTVNQGNAASVGVVGLSLYRLNSIGQAYSSGAYPIVTGTSTGSTNLAPGATVSKIVTLSSSTPNEYRHGVRVEVDANNAIAESNEDNNAREETIS